MDNTDISGVLFSKHKLFITKVLKNAPSNLSSQESTRLVITHQVRMSFYKLGCLIFFYDPQTVNFIFYSVRVGRFKKYGLSKY